MRARTATGRGLRYYLYRNIFLYLLIAPGVLYYILFKYLPMFGIMIAFRDYHPFLGLRGIFTAPWVGLEHFRRFFLSAYSFELIRNTFLISLYKLVWGFPLPIMLALLLNEIGSERFKRTVQTISYMPHFLSMVTICALVRTLTTTSGGLLNTIRVMLGAEAVFFLGEPQYFRSVLVISSIWTNIGWGAIVYLAAIAGVDPQLYEAAMTEGARWYHRMAYVTLPSIMPIISIMLILRMGDLLDAGFEQILLLYSPIVYNVADVIDTFVYREGLLNLNYSYSTAMSLFKAVVALVLVLGSNRLAKSLGYEGIW